MSVTTSGARASDSLRSGRLFFPLLFLPLAAFLSLCHSSSYTLIIACLDRRLDGKMERCCVASLHNLFFRAGEQRVVTSFFSSLPPSLSAFAESQAQVRTGGPSTRSCKRQQRRASPKENGRRVRRWGVQLSLPGKSQIATCARLTCAVACVASHPSTQPPKPQAPGDESTKASCPQRSEGQSQMDDEKLLPPCQLPEHRASPSPSTSGLGDDASTAEQQVPRSTSPQDAANRSRGGG